MYNLTIPSYYANCYSFDDLFGVGFGENFADTIDECFYGNPVHSQRNPSGHYLGRAPMDKELDLNYLMGAIYAVYNCTKEPRRNSAMTKLLGYKYTDDFNGIRVRETFEHNITPVVKLEDVDDNVGNAIIWAAYFFSCIKASFSNEEAEVRDYLRNLFLRQTNMNEYDYSTKHIGSLLYDLYFETTVKKIAEDLNKRETFPIIDEDNDEEEDEDNDEEEDEEFDEEVNEECNEENKEFIETDDKNIVDNKEDEDSSYLVDTKDETIANLTRQNEQLKARVADLEEALNPTGNLEKYKNEVKSVFNPTFPVAGQEVGTINQVRETARRCIDLSKSIEMALFVEACYNIGAIRELYHHKPTDIVRAMMGIRVLSDLDEKEFNRYRDNLHGKFERIEKNGLTNDEQQNIKRIVMRMKDISD